jgi:ABC-type transport system substrate-binding protein
MAPPAYDPKRAISIFEELGLSIAPTTGNGESPARFRFTCILPANFAVWERIALKVQKDLFDVGVDMRIQVLPVDQFSTSIGLGKFDAVLFDMISGPTPGRAYTLWASRQSFAGVYNVFGYENSEAEKLFEVLRTSNDETAIRSATRRLQRVMLEDPPALFLAWSERSRAIRRDIVTPKSDTHDVMWTVWRWSRSPERVAMRQ